MGRAELPAQIGQGNERGLRHGLHNNPSMTPRPLTYISQPIRKPRLRLVTSCAEDDGPPASLPLFRGIVRQRARVGRTQYNFGFACGSFQYGRVVTYFNFASKRSFRNSLSVSCIFARVLLAVVGPTP